MDGGRDEIDILEPVVRVLCLLAVVSKVLLCFTLAIHYSRFLLVQLSNIII